MIRSYVVCYGGPQLPHSASLRLILPMCLGHGQIGGVAVPRAVIVSGSSVALTGSRRSPCGDPPRTAGTRTGDRSTPLGVTCARALGGEVETCPRGEVPAAGVDRSSSIGIGPARATGSRRGEPPPFTSRRRAGSPPHPRSSRCRLRRWPHARPLALPVSAAGKGKAAAGAGAAGSRRARRATGCDRRVLSGRRSMCTTIFSVHALDRGGGRPGVVEPTVSGGRR